MEIIKFDIILTDKDMPSVYDLFLGVNNMFKWHCIAKGSFSKGGLTTLVGNGASADEAMDKCFRLIKEEIRESYG